MFSSDDINGMGETSLSETQELELVPGDMNGYWESLTNLRLKKDGKYPYWKLRKGLTQIQALGSNALRTYGFEARTNKSANNFAPVNYLAIHKANGSVDVYNLESGVVDYTLTGFSGTDPVQFYSSGQFLYVFDEENSKYIDLSEGVVSDYLALDSTPIKSYQDLTSGDVQNMFGYKKGDRVVVFPPDPTNFTKEELTYDVSYSSGTQIDGDVTSDGGYTQSQINAKTWDFSTANKYQAEYEVLAGRVYAYKDGVGVSIDTNGFADEINNSGTDDDGYMYFSVSENITFYVQWTSTDITMPELKVVNPNGLSSDQNFTEIQYGTIAEANGSLVALLDNGNSVSAETSSIWNIAGVDDSFLSLVGESMYDTINTTVHNYVNNLSLEPTEQSKVTAYTYIGQSGFSGDGKYYRQYVVVDMLQDGSVCIPGKPIKVERSQRSTVIGADLSVDAAGDEVAKRFLCCSRYEADEEEVFTPSSQEYSNSPLFIAREIDSNDTNIYDFTGNDALIRPITELLPMASGIPAIFGSGQVVPKSICAFESTVAIGGYDVKRPTPQLYSDFNSSGNIYIDKNGATTAKTATIYFEYTDGSYSQQATISLLDTSNKITIHSLNSLVSAVHLYVNDGTNDHKVDSYQATDPEFGGLSFEIPLSVSGLKQAAVPSNLKVAGQVSLSNYVTIPVPAQNIQISSQTKIFGNDSIVGMVPLDYDPDRNPLRYRLQVFTTDNIQTGYITEVVQGTIVSYNSNFEIATSSRRATSREGITRIDGSIFFQDEQGVNIMGGGQVNLLVDNDQYPIAKNKLTGVVFNEPDGEIWLLFNSSDVLVYDTKSQAIRTFSFGSGNLRTGSYHMNKLLISSGTSLCEAESGSDDLGIPIVGKAITTPLGPNRIYTEITEVHVVGNGSNVTLKIDDQPQREPYSTNFDGFDFTPQKTIGPKAVKMNGTIFAPRKRGIKMRLGFDFENQSTAIEEIITKFINTKNVL